MSTAHPGESPPEDEVLQFDEAEFSAPAPAVQVPTCAGCLRPIPDAYFEVAGKVVCEECRQGIEAAFRGGSGMARFLKASLFGLGAAVAGALIYYISVRVTGYNWSLIAILVGIMVGRSVRAGTSNRGGLVYQFLALFLTYTAIVAMNAGLVVEKFMKDGFLRRAAPGSAEPGKAAAPGTAVAPAAPDPAAAGPVEPLAIIAFFGAMIVFFYVVPVYVVMSAPIAGLIYAFGLWEAWRRTKAALLVINGPFRVGGGLAAGGGHAT